MIQMPIRFQHLLLLFKFCRNWWLVLCKWTLGHRNRYYCFMLTLFHGDMMSYSKLDLSEGCSLSSLWSSLGLQAETFRIFDIFDEYQVTPKEFFFSFYSDLNLSKKDLSLLFETFLNSKQLIVLSNLCSEIKKLTITINNHTDKI